MPAQRRTRTRSTAVARTNEPEVTSDNPESSKDIVGRDENVGIISYDYPDDIMAEIEKQDNIWGEANKACTPDRWLEIATDEFNDLKWAVRTRAEVPNHTIAKERMQLIAVLIRWHVSEL